MSEADPADRGGPDRSNPWTTLSSRLVYENPWISLREDQVLRPDGKDGIYGVVHFKNRAVGVLPVDEEGRIWLVGQHRYPLDAYSWEIPEGGCPDSETPEATALRELREETGLVAGRLELVATSHLSNAVSDEIAYIFRATELTHGPDDPEGCERIEIRRVEWEEVWSMLRRGEITDSISVIALLQEAVRRLERSATGGGG
jgi:8-oxo-dGTP pyrophosphatase MutT (NUDIX family)